MRIAKVLNYFFYKNITLCLVIFWYIWFNGASGFSVFQGFFANMFYNFVYTGVGVFCLGFFDQDVNDKIAIENPGLYSRVCEEYGFRSF